MSVIKLMNGSTISEAATEGGFLDASHFHKMLLKMFGVNPSRFIKQADKKQLIICTPEPLHLETKFYNNKTGKEEVYQV